MNEKRYKSLAVLWGLALIIVQGITLWNVVNNNSGIQLYIFLSIHLIMLVLIGIYLILTLKEIKNGPIIGIGISIIYLVIYNTDHIINTILGVLFMITCLGMVIELGQSKANLKTTTSETSTQSE